MQNGHNAYSWPSRVCTALPLVMIYFLWRSHLTTAAVLSASFQLDHNHHRRALGGGGGGRHGPNSFSCNNTLCDDFSLGTTSAISLGRNEKPSYPQEYTRMKLPSRASSSHAIYGTLLKDSLVEDYTVYKNVSRQPTEMIVAHVRLGTALNGHEGVVHGGILALLMDDLLGYGYEALGDVPLAVTANLSIDFRQPVLENSNIKMMAQLVEREGRKLYWKMNITSPDGATIYCQATSLYIIPRHAYTEQKKK